MLAGSGIEPTVATVSSAQMKPKPIEAPSVSTKPAVPAASSMPIAGVEQGEPRAGPAAGPRGTLAPPQPAPAARAISA